jgi:uncharacterized membrane protein (UPF0127 family)
MRSKYLLPIAMALTLAGCGANTVTITSFDGAKKATLTVEVADDAKERAQGLMERTELKKDTGMLFALPEPQMLTFWMKDTKIPLEIMFFDSAGTFVNSVVMEPCKADPCPTYKSQALAQYAIEVNPDYRESHGIGVGSTLNMKDVQRIAKAK